jgi:hypothetical protein
MTKAILVKIFLATAFLLPLAGCGHRRCCGGPSSSFAPPPVPCCDGAGAGASTLPPQAIPVQPGARF